jgi:hypothetical protein
LKKYIFVKKEKMAESARKRSPQSPGRRSSVMAGGGGGGGLNKLRGMVRMMSLTRYLMIFVSVLV